MQIANVRHPLAASPRYSANYINTFGRQKYVYKRPCMFAVGAVAGLMSPAMTLLPSEFRSVRTLSRRPDRRTTQSRHKLHLPTLPARPNSGQLPQYIDQTNQTRRTVAKYKALAPHQKNHSAQLKLSTRLYLPPP